MKESIERAPRDVYPGRVDPEWLDKVREPGLARRRGEPALPRAASSTVPAEIAVTGVDPLLGTGEGASHPAPLPPPSAPGRTGAGAGAPPPAAAAGGDVDWSAIDALMRILDDHLLHRDAAQPCPFTDHSPEART